jgi:multicomponent K+:H+ antiporter subunit G
MAGEWVVAGLLVVAGVFGLVGSWGLVRLPQTMQRLHAPTKATTVGLGAILVAAMLQGWLTTGRVSLQELLITLFLLLTAPITALYLAKLFIHRHTAPQDLPPTGQGTRWATQDRPAGPPAD